MSKTLGAVLVVLGILLLGTGIAWPALQRGPDEAERRTASEFLSATSGMESAAAIRDPAARQAALAEARERYQATRKTVETAQAARGSTEFWLKVSGGTLAALGAGLLLASKAD